jgi:hypothetical protein
MNHEIDRGLCLVERRCWTEAAAAAAAAVVVVVECAEEMGHLER